MKIELMRYLVCPRCRGDLELRESRQLGAEVVEGRLHCATCATAFQISGGIPRFVAADQYTYTFSRQRQHVRAHFEDYKKDRSGYELLTPSTGLQASDFTSGVSLEVGCGYGRFVEVVSSLGSATVIGIDLSTDSIELAYEFVGTRPNVHLVQCSAFELPFRDGTFERAFSIGVLHHTPDTHAAFKSIVRVVAPQGQVAIWVYPPEMKRVADVWRKLTTRLPLGVVYWFCVLNQVLFSWIRALPGGWRLGRLIPGARPRPGASFWMRVMADFDNLTPRFAWSHAPEEVRTWFEAEGLRDIEVFARRTALRAYVPDFAPQLATQPAGAGES